MTALLEGALDALAAARPIRAAGRVTALTGTVLRATAPGARVGELVRIERQPLGASGGEALLAEVVGFRGPEAVLLPLGEVEGLGPDSTVHPTGEPFTVPLGPALLGRVIDALGRPLDGAPLEGPGLLRGPAVRPAPSPLARRRIRRPLATGVRALDAALTLGEGQRLGLFAGPGLGKSSLLGQLARQAEVDVVVAALVGERGREVRDFVEGQLDPAARARTVCVCATADAPPMARLTCALTATAVAEHFREEGRRVLLLVDSLSRVARAQREVGLAAGEPPARQGFPPSVFTLLPRLLERAGATERGSLTAIYAVLTEADEADDPVADEARALLDGHVTLSRELAARGHFPAVDVPRSLSRVMDDVVDEAQRAGAARLREALALAARADELLALGVHRPGADAAVDEALARRPALLSLLRQGPRERASFDEARASLLSLFPQAQAPR